MMKRVCALVLGFGFVGMPAFGGGAGEAGLCADPELLEFFDGLPYVRQVAVSGTMAYVIGGESNTEMPPGLYGIDVSDPGLPVVLGFAEVSAAWGMSSDMEIHGSVLYIAAGSSFFIVDISTPGFPVLLSTFQIGQTATGVTVVGATAYISRSSGGMRIVDVSDPSDPVLLGLFNSASLYESVAVFSDIAYVVNRLRGLELIDIGDSSAPMLLGLGGVDDALFVEISGDRLYVSSDRGLSVLDVSVPLAPVEIGFYEKAGAARFSVVGTTVYLSLGGSGMQAVDMSDPANPVLLAHYFRGGASGSAAVSDGIAYVAIGGGLGIIDVSGHQTAVLGVVETGAFAMGIDVVDNKAYIAGIVGAVSLEVFDVSDLADPVWLSRLTFDFGHSILASMKVEGGRAYSVDLQNGGMLSIDVSDPLSPAWLPDFYNGESIYDLEVVGTTVYLANGFGGLSILDASDPNNIMMIGSLVTGGEHIQIELDGGLVYLLDGDSRLMIVDASDLWAPVLIGSYDLPLGAGKLRVLGARAYVTGSGIGLAILDVGDPATPGVLGSYDTGEVITDMSVEGDKVYLAGVDRFQVVDAGDPALPVLVASSPVAAHRMFVRDGVAFMIPGLSSLVTMDVDTGCLEGCAADMTGDGSLDFFDIVAFLSAFGFGSPEADFSGDGLLDFFDIAAYLTAFSAGCP